MLNKLQVLEDKYKELTEKISDIEVINDQKTWQKYMKEHADLEPIVMKYREYKEVVDNIKESKEILEEESDEELRELAKMELSDLESRVEPIEDELKILLLPKDPNDEKNVIVEIRGGAGGDEAALFAGDLFRMYSRYAERRRWKTELLSASDTGVGGYKEVSFMIKGKGAYSRLKYESAKSTGTATGQTVSYTPFMAWQKSSAPLCCIPICICITGRAACCCRLTERVILKNFIRRPAPRFWIVR